MFFSLLFIIVIILIFTVSWLSVLLRITTVAAAASGTTATATICHRYVRTSGPTHYIVYAATIILSERIAVSPCVFWGL